MKKTKEELLRQLLEECGAETYISKDGKIKVHKLNPNKLNEEQINFIDCVETTPEEAGMKEEELIDFLDSLRDKVIEDFNLQFDKEKNNDNEKYVDEEYEDEEYEDEEYEDEEYEDEEYEASAKMKGFQVLSDLMDEVGFEELISLFYTFSLAVFGSSSFNTPKQLFSPVEAMAFEHRIDSIAKNMLDHIMKSYRDESNSKVVPYRHEEFALAFAKLLEMSVALNNDLDFAGNVLKQQVKENAVREQQFKKAKSHKSKSSTKIIQFSTDFLI